MVDTKYKSTEDTMTRLQWIKKGYVLKKGSVGIQGWNNRNCTFRVTRYTAEEVYKDEEKAKEQLKIIRKHGVWAANNYHLL